MVGYNPARPQGKHMDRRRVARTVWTGGAGLAGLLALALPATATSAGCIPDGAPSVFYTPQPSCGPMDVNGAVAAVFGAPGSLFFTTIFQRLMDNSAGGGAASPALGYTSPVTPNFNKVDQIIVVKEGRDADLAATAAAPGIDPNLFWVRGGGRFADYKGDANTLGADVSAGAVFVGLDVPVSENIRVGMAGGWSETALDIDDNSGSLDADAFHISAYAGGASGDWRAKGVVTYEYYDIDSDRPVPTGTARANYGAQHVEALAELSYMNMVAPGAAVEPYVSAGLSWLRTDGFTETGGGASNLSATPETNTWPYSLIGMRFLSTVQVGDVTVNPMLDLGWRHVFGDVDANQVYSIVDSGSDVTVSGVPVARDSIVIQAGFDAAFTTGWRASVKYKGELSSDVQEHILTGGVAVPF